MNKKQIPIFFACDENYLPFLSVSLTSLIAHTNNENIYNIYILVSDSNMDITKIKNLELENVTINLINVKDKIGNLSNRLDEVRDYYTQTIFYRLFIGSLFPNLKKAIYLDCDIVVLDDIAKLYDIELESNILGVVKDDVVANNKSFQLYTSLALGIDTSYYFNSGVLLMNLDQYRKECIEELFVDIISRSGFKSLAPDQDYLNVTCFSKVKYIDKEWNFMPLYLDDEVNKKIIHYNMFLKPWHYDVLYNEYFWFYVNLSPYKDEIKYIKETYSSINKSKDFSGVTRMENQISMIINSKQNFNNLVKELSFR